MHIQTFYILVKNIIKNYSKFWINPNGNVNRRIKFNETNFYDSDFELLHAILKTFLDQPQYSDTNLIYRILINRLFSVFWNISIDKIENLRILEYGIFNEIDDKYIKPMLMNINDYFYNSSTLTDKQKDYLNFIIMRHLSKISPSV